jgi:hypothetical protein
MVLEVASDDGYLLRNAVAAGIPCLGVESTASTTAAAEELDVPVVREFFGEALGARFERLLDVIALVTAADNEMIDAMGRILLHDVPDNILPPSQSWV